MWKDLYIYFNHWLKANDQSKNSTILSCNGILIWSPANPIFEKPSHLICTLITKFHAKFTWKITILIKIFAASDEYSLPLMVYVCWRYGLDNIMANDYFSFTYLNQNFRRNYHDIAWTMFTGHSKYFFFNLNCIW